MAKTLDNSYYEKRRQGWLADEDTRAEYERARSEIEQIDAVIRSLDELREDAGMSKAELARRVGRNPASIRRLFTAEQAREYGLIDRVISSHELTRVPTGFAGRVER